LEEGEGLRPRPDARAARHVPGLSGLTPNGHHVVIHAGRSVTGMQPYEEELEDETDEERPVEDEEDVWFDDRFRILHWDP